MSKILVDLEPSTEDALRRQAEREGKSMAQVTMELIEQAEDMKSCCICARLGKCEVWREVQTDARFPIHNVNDAPCDEWELG